MGKKALLLIGSVALLLAIISPPQTASAKAPADIYYEQAKLDYVVRDGGRVDVKMKFAFTNDSPMWEVNEDPRRVPATELENIKVFDSSGNELRYSLENLEEGLAEITVHFDGRMGPGDELTYFITFTARNMLSKNGPECEGRFGKTYPIREYPYEEYRVNVHTGSNARLQLFSYKPKDVTISGDNINYQTKLEASESFDGIQGTWYSSPTYYELTLTEQLKNETSKETTDVNYDLLLFNKGDDWQWPALLDAPSALKNLYVGEENNWRAVLEIDSISPGETEEFEVKVLYQASIYDPSLPESKAGSLSEISSKFDPYLKSLEYWQADHSIIQEAAEDAVGDETNSYLVAKSIIDFVTDRLSYEIQAGRLGALQAYLKRKGDCSEYTDLSIALARASGLPARASYGWGYQDNELVGHAWPEFYFPGVGWQPADPTWAYTEGEIKPGGLPPKFHLPPGRGRRFAPSLSGSSESYLGRLDTTHIERNLRWLNPSEAYARYTYRGAEPKVAESTHVEIISKTKAAEDFLVAAQSNIERATQLLEEENEEDLSSELNLAKHYLSQAKNAPSPKRKIELSQKSIDHSDKVIRSKGESPETEGGRFELPDIPLTLILGGIIIACIALGLWYGLKKRSETS